MPGRDSVIVHGIGLEPHDSIRGREHDSMGVHRQYHPTIRADSHDRVTVRCQQVSLDAAKGKVGVV